jgi:glycosyltransferase involved in cell wall biosynthesis
MSVSGEQLRVAVITPYYREKLEVLQQCHDSVRKQTYPCVHFLVADGYAQDEVRSWPAEHIALSRPHADTGNTPRAIGSLSARSLGYDAVAYLDADNWYYPDHVESMVSLHRQTGAPVCTASRTIHRLDGSLMYADKHECDGRQHVDTSCMFFTRAAFPLLPIWAMMPVQLGPIGDTVMWRSIQGRRIATAHNSKPTVAFRTQYQVHYGNIGEIAPPGTKSNDESTGRAIAWWNSLPEGVRGEWIRSFGWS